jgi:hypothetical protein
MTHFIVRPIVAAAFVFAGVAGSFAAAQAQPAKSPADELPPFIKHLTRFGERADWSHDGKRIIFVSKTFGDVFEVDVATKELRLLTGYYAHAGYTRALYLANGDILLSGPETFDPKNPGPSRVQCALSVLPKDRGKPPAPLGTKCSEGPAVSRKRMHIAWAQVSAQYPGELPEGASRILEADIVYDPAGTPRLANQRVVLESTELPFKCTLETQNFRPPDEKELTFSAYGYQGTEVCGVDLATKKVTNYSNAPNQYDEPEGIFPDGQFTLVECDHHNRKGWQHIDLYKLALDGSGKLVERLTHFNDYPGYKASNPVISDDGKFMAFQMARTTEAAGVGHGLFVYDLSHKGEAVDEDPAAGKAGKTISLFNGQNLDGWTTWTKETGSENPGVFVVENGCLRINGGDGKRAYYGGVTTKQSFENYRLRLDYKWVGPTHGDRAKNARDSGILLHCVGAPEGGASWPGSIEANVMEGDTGSFWLVSNRPKGDGVDDEGKPITLGITVEAVREGPKSELYFKAGGEKVRVEHKDGYCNTGYKDRNWKDVAGYRGAGDIDKPFGEWTHVECVCRGDTIEVYCEGKLVIRGTQASLTKGRICLQAEAADVLYRNIELTPLE